MPKFLPGYRSLTPSAGCARTDLGDYGGTFTSIASLVGRPEIRDFQDEQFFEDAARGTLSNVAWLNSGFLHDGDIKGGHPPFSLCGGENYAVSVLNAVMNGPQWPDTALFLMWDEWGGFYDHVDAPVVERWKDGSPYRYGHRAPCIVVGPYARPGYVSHTLYSHVSLLRFAETIFDLEPLTERDARANDMLDCFDFDQPPLQPISLLPRECYNAPGHKLRFPHGKKAQFVTVKGIALVSKKTFSSLRGGRSSRRSRAASQAVFIGNFL